MKNEAIFKYVKEYHRPLRLLCSRCRGVIRYQTEFTLEDYLALTNERPMERQYCVPCQEAMALETSMASEARIKAFAKREAEKLMSLKTPPGEKKATYRIYQGMRTHDGTIIVSEYRHDYKTYTDPQGRFYMIDGGQEDYIRYSWPIPGEDPNWVKLKKEDGKFVEI